MHMSDGLRHPNSCQFYKKLYILCKLLIYYLLLVLRNVIFLIFKFERKNIYLYVGRFSSHLVSIRSLFVICHSTSGAHYFLLPGTAALGCPLKFLMNLCLPLMATDTGEKGEPTFISSVKMIIFTSLWYIPQISLFESIMLCIYQTTANYLI